MFVFDQILNLNVTKTAAVFVSPLQMQFLHKIKSKSNCLYCHYCLFIYQTHCLYWNSWQWVDCFGGSWKIGHSDVSMGLFTHQRSVDEGQTQPVKVKVFSVVERLR